MNHNCIKIIKKCDFWYYLMWISDKIDILFVNIMKLPMLDKDQ